MGGRVSKYHVVVGLAPHYGALTRMGLLTSGYSAMGERVRGRVSTRTGARLAD